MHSDSLDLPINYTFAHRIRFTKDVFSPENPTFANLLPSNVPPAKILICAEEEIVKNYPHLLSQAETYITALPNTPLTHLPPLTLPGGEQCKTDKESWNHLIQKIETLGLDRHSYLVAIGGGSFLDLVGFAAATAHRGLRLIRLPTTTLSQADSGVGVKCGLNLFGKKNFLGAFAVPYAVINDSLFLASQPRKNSREGLIEAIKVALVKDADFFTWLSDNVNVLQIPDPATLQKAIQQSATLHALHIAHGGDPFELGSQRPLDYGHWAAHKLEQLSGFSLSHAEAVSIGVAIDTLYAVELGLLSQTECIQILSVMRKLYLPLWHPTLELRHPNGTLHLLDGLNEFREHLGGRLTILLLTSIGQTCEIHDVQTNLLETTLKHLKQIARP